MGKIIFIILFSSVKFAITFPIAIYQLKCGFWETIVYTSIGGFLGVILFTLLSEYIMKIWRYYKKKYSLRFSLKNKRLVNKDIRRARKLVKIKNVYGFYGVMLLSPVIISIPVGAFIAVRYFRHRNQIICWMSFSVIFWAFVYTFIYFLFKS